MAGSTYTNIRARQVGYDNKLNNRISPYTVDTKIVEQGHGWTAEYPYFNGTPTKLELLREYVYAPDTSISKSLKYGPTNYYEDYKTGYGLNYDNLGQPVKTNNISSPNKHLLSNSVHHYHSDKSYGIHSRPGLTGAGHFRPRNIYDTNNFLQSTGALSMDHRKRGVQGDMFTRVQPLGPHGKYEQPAFVAKPNKTRQNIDNTINNY